MLDREIADDLRTNGVRYDQEGAVLYYEKDALTPAEMEAFSTLVSQGVKDIEKLLNVPDDKRRTGASPGSPPIFYYISTRIDISRSRMRNVYLPLWRVQRRAAPYLHETAHVIARCSECPMWFSEGFASWVQSHVSENLGGYDAKVFVRGGNRGVDGEAAHWLGTPNGQAVLPYMAGGVPPEIWTERLAVGAPFYVIAQSLVKYLVARAGIEKVGALSDSSDFDQDLESATGDKLVTLTSAWLTSIGLPSAGVAPVRSGPPAGEPSN